MFDDMICYLLQDLTITPPPYVNDWYGPWLSLLVALFPPSSRYMIGFTKHPNFMFEVVKFISDEPRMVLIIKFKNSQHWQAGIPSLEGEIDYLANAAFSKIATSKVYWIGVVGPHWRYGVKEDGKDLEPLIDWHDTTHDQASYDDFQRLAALIADM